MKKTIIITMIILAAFILASCGSVSKDNVKEYEYTFMDDLGRQISIFRPQRVVVLSGSFADIYCLAGGADQIVGAADDTFREFDLSLSADTENTGTAKEPNLEKILELDPDFVIASCNTSSHLNMLESFENMGINAAYFKVSTFEEYLHMLEICTGITGCSQNFEKYGTAVSKEVEDAKSLADGSEPTVLYVRISATGCKIKNSSNSVLGEMLKDLGCVNIADSDETLLEELSIEAIVLNDPEFIFIVFQSADTSVAEEVYRQVLESNSAWQSLSAVQSGKVYIMDQRLYNLKPNAKWGEAYEGLAEIIYR